MKNCILIILFISILFPLYSFAQTDKEQLEPAYIMEEEYQLEFSDEQMIPFISTSNEEEGNFISLLFEAIENNKLTANSTDDENAEISWNEIAQMISPELSEEDDDWGWGPAEKDSVVVNKVRFRYLAFYNEDNLAFHMRLVAVTVIAEKWSEDLLKGYYSLFIVQNTNNQLQEFLTQNTSSHPDYTSRSYWDIVHGINLTDVPVKMTFTSFSFAEKMTGIEFLNAADQDSRIEFPSSVSKAKLRIKVLPTKPNDTEFMDEGVFHNDEDAIMMTGISESFSIFSKNPNLPLIYPGNSRCFSSLADVILMSTMDETIDTYKYDTLKIFDEKISSKYLFQGVDTIKNRFDLFGNMLPDTAIYFIQDISAFMVMELVFEDDAAIPIAIAPGIQTYNALGEISGYGYFKCWTPLNEALQKLLAEYEIFMPNKPPMSFLEYFKQTIYQGEIIHSRPIDNNEWQKMLKVLE
ncbi:MAG: hypothetical protein C0592_06710 [Marinilabiliales bacterium]|nr:MAG: hypothetical protein C0592_06710 [Marinilabiliales bacterium]